MYKTRLVIPTLPLLALLALLLPLSLHAQNDSDLFVDRVEVNVVNIEVFVTDKSGQAIVGLTRDDFELRVDGKAVEISNFYAVGEAIPRPTALPDSASPLAEAAPSEAPPTVEPTRVDPEETDAARQERRLHLAIFVDQTTLEPSHRQRVLDQIGGFLDQRTAADDRVMLVSFNGSLSVEQPLTNDRQLLAEGVDRMRRQVAQGSRKGMDKRILRRRIIQAFLDQQPNTAVGFLNQYKQITRLEVSQSVQAIQSTLRAFAAVPGRKAMLYVSGGLEQRPGADLEEQFFGGAPQLRDTGGDPFRHVIHAANAGQVTFYTLDAQGAGGGSVSAEYSAEQSGGNNRATLEAIQDQNRQAPLIAMADATGGRALLNTFNVDGVLKDVGGDFRHFYSLGFQDITAGDGKTHKIEVEARNPKLRVRHRSSFVSKEASERVADRTLSSLLLDRDENPYGITLAFGPAEKKKRDRYLLPVLVRIPASAVTFLPQGKIASGMLRIFVAAQSADGNVSDVHEQPYPLEVAVDALAHTEGTDIGYQTSLEVRPGEQVVAIGVWDEVSGIESYISGQAQVEGDTKKRKSRKSGRQ